MSSERKDDGYEQTQEQKKAGHSALKLGLVSVASALAGGLAAAWWYRKTLSKLQNPIVNDGSEGSRYRNLEETGDASDDDDVSTRLIHD